MGRGNCDDDDRRRTSQGETDEVVPRQPHGCPFEHNQLQSQLRGCMLLMVASFRLPISSVPPPLLTWLPGLIAANGSFQDPTSEELRGSTALRTELHALAEADSKGSICFNVAVHLWPLGASDEVVDEEQSRRSLRLRGRNFPAVASGIVQ